MRSWILAAAMAAWAGPALADIPPLPPPDSMAGGMAEPQANAAPDVFVKSIYDVKLSAEAVSPDLGRATTSHIILYHFTPDLLTLYKSAVQLDEPFIDGDLFMMAQDWDTKPANIAVRVLNQTARDASAEAVFKAYDQERRVTFTLKATGNGRWQIDNIADSANGDVRSWIAQGLSEAGRR